MWTKIGTSEWYEQQKNKAPQLRFQTEAIMSYSIFSDLKSLSTLRSMALKNKELLNSLETLINTQDSDNLSKVIEKCVEKLALDDLFQLSENSIVIRTFFEDKKYEKFWWPRLKKLGCDLKQGDHVVVFQQLIGSYLAFFYHQWITKGEGHRSDAKDILIEVENRGVYNPFALNPAYESLILPTLGGFADAA